MDEKKRGRPPKSDYISQREASAVLGVDERTVSRMMDRGLLRFRRTPGGQRKLYRSGVQEYLRTQRALLNGTLDKLSEAE